MKLSLLFENEKKIMEERLSDYNKRIYNWHCEGGIEKILIF